MITREAGRQNHDHGDKGRQRHDHASGDQRERGGGDSDSGTRSRGAPVPSAGTDQMSGRPSGVTRVYATVALSSQAAWSSTLFVSASGVTRIVARSSVDSRQPFVGSPSIARLNASRVPSGE